MIKLETERLIIRNFKKKDWKDLAELAMKYEETELAKFDEGPWPSDRNEYRSIIKSFTKTDDFIAVELKNESKLIGLIAKFYDGSNKYSFGYNFHGDYHGKGYATESCKVLLEYMFDVLEAEIIEAGTAKVNEKSTNLLTRLGFRYLGDKVISFRKDKDGNPIEFVGVDYILEKENFSKKRIREN